MSMPKFRSPPPLYLASLFAMTAACLSPAVEIPTSIFSPLRQPWVLRGWQAAYFALPVAHESDLGFLAPGMLAVIANSIYLLLLLLLLIRRRSRKPKFKLMAFAAASATLACGIALLLLHALPLHLGAAMWILSFALLTLALWITPEPVSTRGFPLLLEAHVSCSSAHHHLDVPLAARCPCFLPDTNSANIATTAAPVGSGTVALATRATAPTSIRPHP